MLTSGICAWITKDPGPSPCVPGSGSEFKPCQPHPDTPVTSTLVKMLTAARRKWRILTSRSPAS
ncbi:hypothetical protein NJB18182_37480 [Mycobacterium montefiorense]|nr:hypothetical protein NJB18182_37480 [Mycobacterium montefiorense]